MKKINQPFRKLILVCVNERANGEASCGDKQSIHLFDRLKAYVNENGLKGKVRVSRTGCLGLCELGPNVAVFPDNLWYTAVTDDDVERIICDHLRPEEINSFETQHTGLKIKA